MVRNGIKDPVSRLWDLYKQHSRGGLLRIRAFNLELVGQCEKWNCNNDCILRYTLEISRH